MFSLGKKIFIICLTMIITSISISSITSYAITETLPFTDIKSNDYYINALEYMYTNKYVNGTSETKFSPYINLSRAMLVTILWNMEGNPKVNATNKFPDVKSNMWYTDAIVWASKNKIINGNNDGTFKPSSNITREAVSTILRNYATFKGKSVNTYANLNSFIDAKGVSSWAKDSVQWAIKNKIIKGKSNGTRIDPKGTATRAEVVTMIKNYIDAFPIKDVTNEDKEQNEEVSYTVPTDLTAFYGQTLGDIKLPKGFTFEKELTTPVGNEGTNTFKVKYTPEDKNKKPVTGIEVKIKVSLREFKLNETWTVENEWNLKFTSVVSHTKCNRFDQPEGEQVVIINYTYENLGYAPRYGSGLSISGMDFKVYDENKTIGKKYYSCTHTTSPRACAIGTNCVASIAFVLPTESSSIILDIEKLPSVGYEKEKARFILNLTEDNDDKDDDNSKVYKLNETWTVENKWSFKIDSVETHNNCNEFSDSNKQVVIVKYTYTNLAYNDMNNSIYMHELHVYDEKGVASADDVSCTRHTRSAKIIYPGETCNASLNYELENESSQIVIKVEYKGEKAKFILDVTEPNDNDDNVKVYKLNETWTVENEWNLKIDSVETHNNCSSFSYGNKQVIQLKYTYSSLQGSSGAVIGITAMDVYDEKGVEASYTICQHKTDSEIISPGETCNVSTMYELENESSQIVIKIEYRGEKAKFIIDVGDGYYKLNETWTVPNKWSVTFTSIEKHSLCNSLSSLRGQVFILHYKYTNLGYDNDLYINVLNTKVFDEYGNTLSTYPCTHDIDAKPCYVGGTRTASQAYVIYNSSKIKVKISKAGYTADFLLDMQDDSSEISPETTIKIANEEGDRISEAGINSKIQLIADTNSKNTISWASEDSTVASVDSNGLVTAKRPGYTNISATVDGKIDKHMIMVYAFSDIELLTPHGKTDKISIKLKNNTNSVIKIIGQSGGTVPLSNEKGTPLYNLNGRDSASVEIQPGEVTTLTFAPDSAYADIVGEFDFASDVMIGFTYKLDNKNYYFTYNNTTHMEKEK